MSIDIDLRGLYNPLRDHGLLDPARLAGTTPAEVAILVRPLRDWCGR